MPILNVKCIVCSCLMLPKFKEMYDDRYGYNGYFDIYECPSCGQAQTTPLMHDDELGPLYGKYYPRREIDIQGLIEQAKDPSNPRVIRDRWLIGNDNQGQYLAKPGMKVLDYGCGAGASLLELKALGAEAYGIEADPNVQQVVDSLGLNIHIGTIEDSPFKTEKFDLIILNQVLEHIPQPDILLKKFVSLLKPSGKLVLSFPNAGSLYAHFFKRNWINWHIPYHLHHFNKKSAHKFIENHGWQVVSCRTITPNLWTVLQCRAAVETTIMAQPSPMWTGASVEIDNASIVTKSSRLHRLLRKFVLSVSRPIPKLALIIFNRFIDKIGYGDSLLIEIKFINK